MLPLTRYNTRAFALPELAATTVVSAVLIALLVVSTARSRGSAQQQGSIANLHEFAAITSSYAADNTDQYWSFSWRRADANRSQFPDLNGPYLNVFQPSAAQATDIIRRRSRFTTADRLPLWAPGFIYSHLVLSDYLDVSAALPFATSPGDRFRVLIQNDPEGYLAGRYDPPDNGGGQPTPLNRSATMLLSSSYQLPPAFWSPDYSTSTRGVISPDSTYGRYSFVGEPVDFGTRRTTEVNFPSQKVLLFDTAQWSGTPDPIFWGYSDARPAMLFCDGSTHARPTGAANRGFNPAAPLSPIFSVLTYEPRLGDPPARPDLPYVFGSFLFTRSGLHGRDFDGPEVAVTP